MVLPGTPLSSLLQGSLLVEHGWEQALALVLICLGQG